MTNAGASETPARGAEGGKSLKEQNRWQLWIIVAANALFLYGVIQADAVRAHRAFLHARVRLLAETTAE